MADNGNQSEEEYESQANRDNQLTPHDGISAPVPSSTAPVHVPTPPHYPYLGQPGPSHQHNSEYWPQQNHQPAWMLPYHMQHIMAQHFMGMGPSQASAASSSQSMPGMSPSTPPNPPQSDNQGLGTLAKAMEKIDETLQKVLNSLPQTSAAATPTSTSTSEAGGRLTTRPRPRYYWEDEQEEQEDQLSDDFEQPSSSRCPRNKKLPPFKRGPGRPRKVPAPPPSKKTRTSTDSVPSAASGSEFICSVCYARPPTCKLDGCPHCFCETCLLKLVEQDGPLQKCPKCRKFFDTWETVFF